MSDLLRDVGTEVLFGTKVYVRVFATIAVMRGIAWALEQWWGSPEIWSHGDQFLKAFQFRPEEAPEVEPQPQGQPQLLLHHLGFKYYRHNDVYQGQMLGPCPLREVAPCARCDWFVQGLNGGRSWCAAQTKLRLMDRPEWRDKDLWDIKAELEREYGRAA